MLLDHHRAELLSSGIDTGYIDRNFRSIENSHELDRLLERNCYRRQKHSDDLVPGWIVEGIDPRSNPMAGMPGLGAIQYKPDRPIAVLDDDGQPIKRRDGTFKFRKYLNPTKRLATPLFLDTGDLETWLQAIADTGILIWLVEGAKKAAALLSQGEIAISLPGVFQGQKLGVLHEWLQLFATPGRRWMLGFDMDQHENSNVCKALLQLGSLLKSHGGIVHIAQWDTSHKGIDDFLVQTTNPALALQQIKSQSPTLEQWKIETQAIREQRPAAPNLLQQATAHLYPPSLKLICLDDQFYVWKTTHYEWIPEPIELRRIAEFCNTFTLPDKDGNDTFPLADPRWVNRILDWCKYNRSRDAREIAPQGYINCRNGVLRLKWRGNTLERMLCPHSPELIFIEKPTVTYDPKADAQHLDRLLECLEPEPREILLRTLACSLDVDFFRRSLGRIRALLAWGTGSNGKDTLRVLLSKLFGSQETSCCSLSDFQEYDRGRKFNLSALEHSRVNWSSENIDSVRIDKMQVVKNAISGDSFQFEEKNKQGHSGHVKAVFVFNCNELPKFLSSRESESTRWAIIPFRKTYVKNPNPNQNELPIDPRFKDDFQFIEKNLLPAFLNLLLEKAETVAREGINYDGVQAEITELQRASSHLIQFAQDRGLEYNAAGKIAVTEIWEELLDWYVANGFAAEEISSTGKTKLLWLDEGNKYDKLVKHSRFVLERIQEIFPKVRRLVDGTSRLVYLEGLQFSSPRQSEPATPEPEAQKEELQEPEKLQEPEPATVEVTSEQKPSRKKILNHAPLHPQRGQLVFAPPSARFFRKQTTLPRHALLSQHKDKSWLPLSAITDNKLFHLLYGYLEVYRTEGEIVICRNNDAQIRVAYNRTDLLEVVPDG